MPGWNNKQNVLHFIEIYRTLPALWKVKSKDYSNKLTRELAYSKLIKFCRKFDPSADKQYVVNKINNLRSAFRKELKKVETSKLSGAGSDEIYESKLWYFPHLLFIKDQEVPMTGMCSLDLDMIENAHPPSSSLDPSHLESELPLSPQAKSEASINLDISGNQEPESKSQLLEEEGIERSINRTPVSANPPQATKKSRKRKPDGDDLMEDAGERLLKPWVEDEFDVFGKNIAFRLRNLPKEQRVHAQKYMSDILYEAELGQLSRAPHYGFTAALHN